MSWKTALAKAEPKFTQISEISGLDWQTEAMFALQAINNSPALQECSGESIRNAVINVAAVGISLNPVKKHAYLVPRKGTACLDISYLGLIQIATDTGSILWAKAELVYEDDIFEYRGVNHLPKHTSHPFSASRGVIVGAYCLARLFNGEYLVETIPAAELQKIKSLSKAKSGPWIDFYGEMCKKTVIKRASKTWPKTDRTNRLDKAIHIANDNEGITFEAVPLVSNEEITILQDKINQSSIGEDEILAFFSIDKLSSLVQSKFDRAINILEEGL